MTGPDQITVSEQFFIDERRRWGDIDLALDNTALTAGRIPLVSGVGFTGLDESLAKALNDFATHIKTYLADGGYQATCMGELVRLTRQEGTAAPRSLGHALLGWTEVRHQLSTVSSHITRHSDGWDSVSASIYKARCSEQEDAVGIAITAVESMQDLLTEKLVNLATEFQNLNEAVAPIIPSFSDGASFIKTLLEPWKWIDTITTVAAVVDAAIETTQEVTKALTDIVSNTLKQAVAIEQAEAAMNDRFFGKWPVAGVPYPSSPAGPPSGPMHYQAV